jgi:hypothetical protein
MYEDYVPAQYVINNKAYILLLNNIQTVFSIYPKQNNIYASIKQNI